jgi:hypothetical protein
MAKRMMDYGVDANNDLVIGAGGDFVRAESTGQHQKQLVICNKNDYKQNPTICVGAINYIDDDAPNDLIAAISEQFSGDGMDVQRVIINSAGIIDANAYYK